MENNINQYKSKFLYHFTKREILIEHILPSYKLKLNTLQKTNDPKEKKMSVLNSIKNLTYAGEYLDIKARLHNSLDNVCQICCFSGDYLINHKEFNGYNLPRMWATYGDNHEGICLKIDFDKFFIENKVDNDICFLDNLVYVTEINHILTKKKNQFESDYEKVTLQLIKDNLKSLFFVKHLDWNTEREIRYVTLMKKDYCSIKNSIESIIVGMDFNKKYLASIKNQMDPVADIYEIDYDFKDGQLKTLKIN